MRRSSAWLAALMLAGFALGASLAVGGSAGAAPRAQGATPTPYSCDNLAAGTPATGANAMGSMTMGTPASAMGGMTMGTPSAQADVDLLYIDMMIPHHRGIIALAQAALPRLTDPRLQTIAQNIIDAQSAEIPELQGYRQQFYGDAPMQPMDQGMMDRLMPGMAMDMGQMSMQMDPNAEAAAFCAADNPDLAFIDMSVAHHQTAIMVSQTALNQATHQEIKDFAQKVIDAQQREIDELTQIRAELTGAGTPAA